MNTMEHKNRAHRHEAALRAYEQAVWREAREIEQKKKHDFGERNSVRRKSHLKSKG